MDTDKCLEKTRRHLTIGMCGVVSLEQLCHKLNLTRLAYIRLVHFGLNTCNCKFCKFVSFTMITHNDQKVSENYVFDMQKELLDYCRSDVNVLTVYSLEKTL